MRTTVALDDDAAALAQADAQARSLRLGKVMSEPIRRASAPPMVLKTEAPKHKLLHPKHRLPAPPNAQRLSSGGPDSRIASSAGVQQRLHQRIDADRLGDVVVHAGGEALLAVAGQLSIQGLCPPTSNNSFNLV